MLDVVYIPQEVHHGKVWAARERNLSLYADYGRISGRDHEWVQDALTVTLAILCRMGIDANLNKTKAMICMPGFIWGQHN